MAILDTAIDHNHFPGKKITYEAKNFAILVIKCLSDVSVASTVHGTIFSAVADGASCETEMEIIPRGVAPSAKLVVYQIADQKSCYTEAVLAALQDIATEYRS